MNPLDGQSDPSEVRLADRRFPNIPEPLAAVLLATLLVGSAFLLQGNIGLSLFDEGYLWYGFWRTSLGEVPNLDFQSYDPGRYYWSAAWSLLLGNGIIALRLSVALFQIAGLTCGLLALRRLFRSWWVILLAGVILLLWMQPRHKIFESSLAMTAVYVAVLLIEHPSPRRHFLAGMFVGVAAFFGRNHGLYGLVAFSSLILLIWVRIDRKELPKRVALWGAGVTVGYAPMWLMLLFVPGFGDAFMSQLLSQLSRGSTNIPLPVPWPWTVDLAATSKIGVMTQLTTGLLFLLMPVFFLTAGLWCLFARRELLIRNALLPASVLVGACYMHHAFARPAPNHLAQAIHPLLLGVLCLPFVAKWIPKNAACAGVFALVLAMTALSAAQLQPFLWKMVLPAGAFVKLDVNGDELWVDRSNAQIISVVRQINSQYVGEDEGLLVAPYWPGLYPCLQRKSPLWETYFLWKGPARVQQEQIEELKRQNVNWIIWSNLVMASATNQRFQTTHEVLWQYIKDDFEPFPVRGLPPTCQVLRRK